MKKIKKYDDCTYLLENRYNGPKEAFQVLINLLKKEKLSSNTSLVDVGCAAGELIFNIKKHFPQINITGIDILQSLLDKAKKKTSEDIIYKKKDISRKNIKLGRYDIIILSAVLSIFDNPKIILNNLLRSLNTGGKIYIFSLFNPYPYNVYIKYEDYRNAKNILQSGLNNFSLDYIIKFFEKKNKKVKIFPFHMKKKLKK